MFLLSGDLRDFLVHLHHPALDVAHALHEFLELRARHALVGVLHERVGTLDGGAVAHGYPHQVRLLDHLPHVRFHARVVIDVFLLEVDVKVHVVPELVLLVLVEVEAGPPEVGHVVVRRPAEPAHEARVLQNVFPDVVFLAQSPKPVHHQTRDDVEEQHPHPHEKRQVKQHPRHVLRLPVADVVEHLPHGAPRHRQVKNEEEAGHHAVAALGLLVVGLAVVDEPLFKVLEAELGVDHHRADEQVEHPPELLDVVGDASGDVSEHGGVVHDVHHHEGEKRGLVEAVDGERHEQHVVAEERFGDQHVKGHAEEAGLGRVGHHDVVAQAAQGPGQVDAEDQEQVQPRVWVVGVVELVHDDEQHVEHQGHEPPREGAQVAVVLLLQGHLLDALLHVVVELPDDDGHLRDGQERHDDDVAQQVEDGERQGNHQAPKVRVVAQAVRQAVVDAAVPELFRVAVARHDDVDVEQDHQRVHTPLDVHDVVVDEGVDLRPLAELVDLLHLRHENRRLRDQLLHTLLVGGEVRGHQKVVPGLQGQVRALFRAGKRHGLNALVPAHFDHGNVLVHHVLVRFLLDKLNRLLLVVEPLHHGELHQHVLHRRHGVQTPRLHLLHRVVVELRRLGGLGEQRGQVLPEHVKHLRLQLAGQKRVHFQVFAALQARANQVRRRGFHPQPEHGAHARVERGLQDLVQTRHKPVREHQLLLVAVARPLHRLGQQVHGVAQQLHLRFLHQLQHLRRLALLNHQCRGVGEQVHVLRVAFLAADQVLAAQVVALAQLLQAHERLRRVLKPAPVFGGHHLVLPRRHPLLALLDGPRRRRHARPQVKQELVVPVGPVHVGFHRALHHEVSAVEELHQQLNPLVRQVAFEVGGVRADGVEHHLDHALFRQKVLAHRVGKPLLFGHVAHVLLLPVLVGAPPQRVRPQGTEHPQARALVGVVVVLLHVTNHAVH
mmetsp:Transcript_73353/g.147703  ORF Transcript_73353/g.147703 Transcript_73353/m.147703 type:complete len:945 (-) Transcript_73353:1080-3914(-)